MLFSFLIAYFYYENNGIRTAFYVHMETTCMDMGMCMRMRMVCGLRIARTWIPCLTHNLWIMRLGKVLQMIRAV